MVVTKTLPSPQFRVQVTGSVVPSSTKSVTASTSTAGSVCT